MQALFRTVYRVCLITGVLICLSSQKWYESRVVVLESSSDVLAPLEGLDIAWEKESGNFERLVGEGIMETRLLVSILFSASINGYEFTYKPKNDRTGVQEVFHLALLDTIEPEDPRIKTISQGILENTVTVIYRYDLHEHQVSWLRSWYVADVLTSKGTGKARIKDLVTYGSKIAALENAIQDAIVTKLKQRIPTQPLAVEGLVRVYSQPYFYQSEEFYYSKVNVTIQLKKVTSQQLY